MSTTDYQNFSIEEVKPYNLKLSIAYLLIRYRVFIDEYKRKINQEFSLKDFKAKHYIFSIGAQRLGIVRIIYENNKVELGRMAITRENRNAGYGSILISQIIAYIRSNSKIESISLYTLDNSLISFYKKFGFIENGEVFFDAIPYMNMVKFFKR